MTHYSRKREDEKPHMIIGAYTGFIISDCIHLRLGNRGVKGLPHTRENGQMN